MVKKSVFLAIVLMAVELAVVSAQDNSQMERELLQVQQELNAGRITLIQAQQRASEIMEKYVGLSNATGNRPGTTITRTYTYDVPNSARAGAGAAAQARSEANYRAVQRFEAENPGYEIRNQQSQHDGIRTLTVTITGRKRN